MSTLAETLADPDQNVVLTGFMGTGKSTVGRRLAQRLRFDFVDTDQLIEAKHGAIADLFATHGEDHFRRLERELTATLAGARRHVVATGGRTMLDRTTETTLGASGRVFCLHASIEAIIERVTNSQSGVRRPLLEAPDVEGRIRELWAERRAAYRRFPMVTTDNGSTDHVAGQLERLVGTRPTVVAQGRCTVIGIGIAARARAHPMADATAIDIGRLQPATGLDAGALIAMQRDLAARLSPA